MGGGDDPFDRFSKSKGTGELFVRHDGIGVSSKVFLEWTRVFSPRVFRTTFFPCLVTRGCCNSNRTDLSSERTQLERDEIEKASAGVRENVP